MFRHPIFGTTKRAPVGFSWTTAFLAFWPALLRGDFKWAAIQFGIIFGVALFTYGFGVPVVWIAFGVIYNKIYIKELIKNGYLVERLESQYSLKQLQAQMEVLLPIVENYGAPSTSTRSTGSSDDLPPGSLIGRDLI